MGLNEKTIKTITDALFLPEKEAEGQLTPFQNERRKRWMWCISQKLDNPLIPDKELVEQLEGGIPDIFDSVGRNTAYRDLAAVAKVMGNIQLAAKSWYRYMIIEGAKKAYQIALDKGDSKGMASALDKIGKYTMADKPDNDVDWSQMIPLDIEPSADPDLLENITPVENLDERRKELRDLFKSETLQSLATDAEFEEE